MSNLDYIINYNFHHVICNLNLILIKILEMLL